MPLPEAPGLRWFRYQFKSIDKSRTNYYLHPCQWNVIPGQKQSKDQKGL